MTRAEFVVAWQAIRTFAREFPHASVAAWDHLRAESEAGRIAIACLTDRHRQGEDHLRAETFRRATGAERRSDGFLFGVAVREARDRAARDHARLLCTWRLLRLRAERRDRDFQRGLFAHYV